MKIKVIGLTAFFTLVFIILSLMLIIGPKIFISHAYPTISIKNDFLFYILAASCIFYIDEANNGNTSKLLIILPGLTGFLFLFGLDSWHNGFNANNVPADFVLSFWAFFSLRHLYFLWKKNKPLYLSMEALFFGLIFPLLFIIALILLGKTIIWFPKTDDTLLYTIDATLGFHPNFLASKIFISFPSIIQLGLEVIYNALPVALIVTYLSIPAINRRDRYQLGLEFFIIGTIGIPLYFLFPSCGPICAYGPTWIFHAPPVFATPQTPITPLLWDLPRNNLPSLHTAWIICVWRYLQKQGFLIRIASHLWALSALFATLVIGQHYLIDIVTGAAFALIVHGLCARNVSVNSPHRLRAILIGFTLFFGWLIMIQYGLTLLRFSPHVTIMLYISTLFTSIILTSALSKAE